MCTGSRTFGRTSARDFGPRIGFAYRITPKWTLRGAYGINGIHGTEVAKPPSGEGSAVAITDAFDASTLLADANQYSTRHHDKTFAEGQFSDLSVPEDPSKQFECGGNGWYGEQTLDVEAAWTSQQEGRRLERRNRAPLGVQPLERELGDDLAPRLARSR